MLSQTSRSVPGMFLYVLSVRPLSTTSSCSHIWPGARMSEWHSAIERAGQPGGRFGAAMVFEGGECGSWDR